MSTFRGIMKEFPDISVDYFRTAPGTRTPRAHFLSHVHSDHLTGLESFKATFIYCSAATRSLLVNLERRAHRLNFANGILETRKQTYKHLAKRLRAIPMETCVNIELEPGNVIQVTLFDANHCTGAVMFLFEQDRKAVLYTGDIRSEPWFVNNLVRNPLLIEYTSGLKRLDCIYLDTSNIEPITFPTKAEGLNELISQVQKYPLGTTFHLTAFTFGYEEVWLALSKALASPVHLDEYKLRLYHSLPTSTPGPVLGNFEIGHKLVPSFLTEDTHVKLHSCEKGMQCSAINDDTVWIFPIITRLDSGVEIGEIGIGGGGGDLHEQFVLDLSQMSLHQFLSTFGDPQDEALNVDIALLYAKAYKSGRSALPLDGIGTKDDEDNVTVSQIAEKIRTLAIQKRTGRKSNSIAKTAEKNQMAAESLPRVIKFPYSRHSSYEELCHLVRIFKPDDVYPCTTDEEYWHTTKKSIRALFGEECSGNTFAYDAELAEWVAARELQKDASSLESIASTQRSQDSPSPSGYDARDGSPTPDVKPIGTAKSVLTTVPMNPMQIADAGLLGEPTSAKVFPTESTGPYMSSFQEAATSGVGGTVMPVRTPSAPRHTRITNASRNSANVPTSSSQNLPAREADDATGGADAETNSTPGKVVFEVPNSLVRYQRDSNDVPLANDTDGKELLIDSGVVVGSDGAEHRRTTTWDNSDTTLNETPHKRMLAESPGSESQRLRRKVILDSLDELRVSKRVCLSGPDSSSGTSNTQTSSLPQLLPHLDTGHLVSANDRLVESSIIQSSPALGVLLDAEKSQLLEFQAASDHGEVASVGTNGYDGSESESDKTTLDEELAYYDHVDEVFRCKSCGSEVWRINGFCTGHCSGTLIQEPYFEVGSDSGEDGSHKPQPLRIAANEYSDEIDTESIAQEIAGNYIDNDPEAYDSQDSATNFCDEYDLADPFINDATDSESDTEGSTNEGYGIEDIEDVGYKAKYEQLVAHAAHDREELENLRQTNYRLCDSLEELTESYTDLREACGISSTSVSDVDIEDDNIFDDDGNIIVDVEVPVNAVAEVLVPDSSKNSSFQNAKDVVMEQAGEQSQNSQLDTQRLEDRVSGFEAADNDAWYEVSLMSTGANYTYPEVEL